MQPFRWDHGRQKERKFNHHRILGARDLFARPAPQLTFQTDLRSRLIPTTSAAPARSGPTRR
jgi:hypothetical protein